MLTALQGLGSGSLFQLTTPRCVVHRNILVPSQRTSAFSVNSFYKLWRFSLKKLMPYMFPIQGNGGWAVQPELLLLLSLYSALPPALNLSQCLRESLLLSNKKSQECSLEVLCLPLTSASRCSLLTVTECLKCVTEYLVPLVK